jgi:hypothetical protein
MLQRVAWQNFTDVSEVPTASIVSALMMELEITSEKLLNPLIMEAVNNHKMSVNFYQTT